MPRRQLREHRRSGRGPSPRRDRVDIAAEPIMASEDFGVLARSVPACLAFLGNGTEPGAGGVPLHSYDYDFNDDNLAAGIAYHREVVNESLAETDAHTTSSPITHACLKPPEPLGLRPSIQMSVAMRAG